MTREKLFEYVLNYFQSTMPDADTELKYNDSFHLIVAVILSAQCTDKRVNEITPELLKVYPTPQEMAEASSSEIFEFIKSCSYPNNKAKYLSGMSRMLADHFGGIVPDDIEELQRLPGVGRKSANVIASVVFNKPAMAVDTHVFRVASRIGLTLNSKTPLDTEKQLVQFIPEELLPKAHHWLILHGRYICLARKPKCDECGLKSVCNYYNSVIKKI